MAVSDLAKMLGKTNKSGHDFEVSIETFAPLRTEKVAQELRLESLGAQRGAENEPPSTTNGFDYVEQSIVDYIEHERDTSENQFRDMMNTYRDRLADLEFEGKIDQILHVADVASGDLRAEGEKGLDRLNSLRRDLTEAERHLEAFRQEHGLNRPAEFPRTSTDMWVRKGVLFALVVLEVLANGMFFAQAPISDRLQGKRRSAGSLIAWLSDRLRQSKGQPENSHLIFDWTAPAIGALVAVSR